MHAFDAPLKYRHDMARKDQYNNSVEGWPERSAFSTFGGLTDDAETVL